MPDEVSVCYYAPLMRASGPKREREYNIPSLSNPTLDMRQELEKFIMISVNT